MNLTGVLHHLHHNSRRNNHMLRGSEHAYAIGSLCHDYRCDIYYYCSVFDGYSEY